MYDIVTVLIIIKVVYALVWFKWEIPPVFTTV